MKYLGRNLTWCGNNKREVNDKNKMGILKFIIQKSAIKAAENIAIIAADTVNNYVDKKQIKTKVTKKAKAPKETDENPGVVYYKVPTAADDYIGEDKDTAFFELKAYGFENIVLLPKKDLVTGWLNKDGEIISVKINGKSDFKKNSKFPARSRVTIEYHAFRDKGDVT